jgi:hypothetical protein
MSSTFLGSLGLAAALGLAMASPARGVTMAELWPNEDGRGWYYDQHYEAIGSFPQVADNQIRIFFDGTTVAPDGIQAQYLRHTLIAGPALEGTTLAEFPDPFLRQAWLARPDLREKIQSALAEAPCPEYAPSGRYAVLLNGEFAWVRSTDEVAAWRCNAANTRSWRWLVSDLTIGNTFTLQLLPDFTSDVFLHGTIAAVEPVTVPAGTFQGCVRVDYVIDYGLSVCVDDRGVVTGTTRAETRGSVYYAPNEGPVRSDEEFVPAEVTGACQGFPTSRTSLRLSSPSVPVRPATWGGLKVRYR